MWNRFQLFDGSHEPPPGIDSSFEATPPSSTWNRFQGWRVRGSRLRAPRAAAPASQPRAAAPLGFRRTARPGPGSLATEPRALSVAAHGPERKARAPSVPNATFARRARPQLEITARRGRRPPGTGDAFQREEEPVCASPCRSPARGRLERECSSAPPLPLSPWRVEACRS